MILTLSLKRSNEDIGIGSENDPTSKVISSPEFTIISSPSCVNVLYENDRFGKDLLKTSLFD